MLTMKMVQFIRLIVLLSVCLTGSVFLPRAFSQTENLNELLLEEDELKTDAFNEFDFTQKNNQRKNDLTNLQKAKFKLISGDLKTAIFFLERIDSKTSAYLSIKKRYMAIIYFIQGKFLQSLHELDNKNQLESNLKNEYQENCLLRLINFMAINDTNSLLKEKKICQFYTKTYSGNDQFWLDSMIKLKTSDRQGLHKNLLTDISSLFFDDEMSRLWLKTGLYLNKEKQIEALLNELPESSYESKRLREIIAFMYLRSGKTQKALLFIEDVDTVNAENIKGNLNLKAKEYELAYGHFKLALKKKQDSLNSIERAIPLAWLLNEWADGSSLLQNYVGKDLDLRKKKALQIAFLIREKKFQTAQNELTLLKIAFKNEPPLEVRIMDAYVNLILTEKDKHQDKRAIQESAEKSCRSFDGMSCWLLLQTLTWENLGKTIKREDPIFSDKTMTVESLKEKSPVFPLIEDKTIDQNDIEELDGENIL